MIHLVLLGKLFLKDDVQPLVVKLQMLRDKIDKHYSKGTSISFDTVPLHDVAAVLKLFLRELPEPLLMSQRVNAFIKVDSKCRFSLLLLTEFSHVLCSIFIVNSALQGQVSAVADEPMCHAASRHMCFKQRWTLSVMNLRLN